LEVIVARPKKEKNIEIDDILDDEGNPTNPNKNTKDLNAQIFERQVEGSYAGDATRPGRGMYAGMAHPHEFLVFYREAKKKPHRGAPWGYESQEALEREIDAYFDFCIHRRIAVSVAGLGAWLGVSTATLGYWKRNRETLPYYECVELAIAFIHGMMEQGALDGNVPATVYNFLARNYNGLKDIQEYSVEPVKQLSIMEQDRIINALPED
jgi:hypothetical protein